MARATSFQTNFQLITSVYVDTEAFSVPRGPDLSFRFIQVTTKVSRILYHSVMQIFSAFYRSTWLRNLACTLLNYLDEDRDLGPSNFTGY